MYVTGVYSCLSGSTGFSEGYYWVGRSPFHWHRECLSVNIRSGACASAGQPEGAGWRPLTGYLKGINYSQRGLSVVLITGILNDSHLRLTDSYIYRIPLRLVKLEVEVNYGASHRRM